MTLAQWEAAWAKHRARKAAPTAKPDVKLEVVPPLTDVESAWKCRHGKGIFEGCAVCAEMYPRFKSLTPPSKQSFMGFKTDGTPYSLDPYPRLNATLRELSGNISVPFEWINLDSPMPTHEQLLAAIPQIATDTSPLK